MYELNINVPNAIKGEAHNIPLPGLVSGGIEPGRRPQQVLSCNPATEGHNRPIGAKQTQYEVSDEIDEG
jgi:hypothetical protein